MSEPTTWVADPRLAWTPTITCARPAGLDADTLRDRLVRMNDTLRPGSSTAPVVESADGLELLRRTAAARSGGPVTGGLGPGTLAVSIDHAVGDGLSLLAALTEVTGVPLSSGFAGVGGRESQHGFVAARVRRLAEVLFSPPAVLPSTAAAVADDAAWTGDVFASRSVAGAHGTTAVIAATARAVTQELLTGRARRRVRIAVGLSTVSGSCPRLADDSALLRLSPATLGSPERIRAALRTQGLEPDPGDEAYERRPGLARLTTHVQGRLASRLGSTVLVSHLGTVATGSALPGLAFYPVTGGASGVSVGALVQDGRTLLTARARARQHDVAGLARVLDAVAERLG